jgi:hypothetical protein
VSKEGWCKQGADQNGRGKDNCDWVAHKAISFFDLQSGSHVNIIAGRQ